MPHFGQSPGLALTTSGCIGQVYCPLATVFARTFCRRVGTSKYRPAAAPTKIVNTRMPRNSRRFLEKKFMVDWVRCYIPPRLFLFMEGCALFGVLLLTLPAIAAPVGGIPRTIKDSSAKTTSRCAATSTLSN